MKILFKSTLNCVLFIRILLITQASIGTDVTYEKFHVDDVAWAKLQLMIDIHALPFFPPSCRISHDGHSQLRLTDNNHDNSMKSPFYKKELHIVLALFLVVWKALCFESFIYYLLSIIYFLFIGMFSTDIILCKGNLG